MLDFKFSAQLNRRIFLHNCNKLEVNGKRFAGLDRFSRGIRASFKMPDDRFFSKVIKHICETFMQICHIFKNFLQLNTFVGRIEIHGAFFPLIKKRHGLKNHHAGLEAGSFFR